MSDHWSWQPPEPSREPRVDTEAGAPDWSTTPMTPYDEPQPAHVRWGGAVRFGLAGLALGALLEVPVHAALHHGDDTSPTADDHRQTAPLTPGRSSSAPTTPALDPAAVARKVDPGVVDITTETRTGTAAGTGMVLTGTGDILTNNHVVDGATSITVRLTSTGRHYTAHVVGTAPTEDVAVIRVVGGSGLTPVPLGDSDKVRVGDAVVALGNAGGRGGTPVVASGSVVALNRAITASDAGGGNAQHLTGLIQTDAPIEPGDSGGPLVNASAQVIGMDSAASQASRLAPSAHEGFAIPINHALALAHDIEAGHASSTVHLGVPGMLGVSVTNDPSVVGARIDTVESGSPADRAGIRSGDVIVAVGSTDVSSASELGTAVRAHRSGESVTVTWTSGSSGRRTAHITLEDGPAD